MKEKKSRRMHVILPEELFKFFKRFSIDTNLSMTEIIVQYIKYLMKSEERREARAKTEQVDAGKSRGDERIVTSEQE